MRPWSEVVRIQAEAEAARSPGYDSWGMRWLLSPSGEVVMLQLPNEHFEHPNGATLGRYERNGNWLELHVEGYAIDRSGMSEEDLAEFDAMLEEMAALESDALLEEGQAEDGPQIDSSLALADVVAEQVPGTDSDDYTRSRFLVVSYRGGELLIDEDMLVMQATGWKGEGSLSLSPSAWRVPGLAPDSEASEFEIEDPLRANLPWELARLLRQDAIEVRVSDVLQTAESLQWTYQSAEVQLQLDRGEQHGLYAGMDIYGLPPDESLFAEVYEVHPQHSMARVHVQRFSPRDRPQLPTVGARATTRRQSSVGCGVDATVAVRGKVLAVAQSVNELQWDEEGFAWFELTLDQGRSHGLIEGDSLGSEDDEISGEGKVVSVGSDQSTVLWRLRRYDENSQVSPPLAGSALVTPAWRRAAYDTFKLPGSTPH